MAKSDDLFPGKPLDVRLANALEALRVLADAVGRHQVDASPEVDDQIDAAYATARDALHENRTKTKDYRR